MNFSIFMADLKEIYYKTKYGKLLLGDSIELLKGKLSKNLKGKVNLLITSPPFPLNNKKKYGNFQGEEYKEWFKSLAPIFEDLCPIKTLIPFFSKYFILSERETSEPVISKP